MAWNRMDRILVDVDGVLADFVGGTLDELHRLGGPRLTPEHWVTWDGLDIMPEEFREDVKNAWRRQGFCENLREYPEAFLAVMTLRQILPVHFVTAPLPLSKFWYQERHDWLVDRFQARHSGDITFTHEKHGIHGIALVDDKPSHIEEWQDEHPYGLAILYAQPYNKPMPGVMRTNDWSEIVRAISDLEGQ
jgi:5'(3')-deoxyribonucleotidase